MKIISIILSVLSTLLGALFSLMMFVFVLMGSGNSKPEEWPMIRALMIAIGVGGVVCLVGGFWLLAVGRVWAGAIVGGLPIVAFIVMYVWETAQP